MKSGKTHGRGRSSPVSVLFDDVAERTRHLRTDPQSQILLSIAGVAVAAAVGVAVSRYRSGPHA